MTEVQLGVHPRKRRQTISKLCEAFDTETALASLLDQPPPSSNHATKHTETDTGIKERYYFLATVGLFPLCFIAHVSEFCFGRLHLDSEDILRPFRERSN